MKKAVLFDLDGTLLPMDTDKFVRAYFKLLGAKLAPYGYTDSNRLFKSVWAGTAAMQHNDGSMTNLEAFWRRFAECEGERALNDKPVFEDFYANEFNGAQSSCGFMSEAGRLIKRLKSAGIRVILASNPLFPMAAQLNRMRWAGLDAADFEHITAYEDYHYCKPNPNYYLEICANTGLSPDECIMVGNDAGEDMTSLEVGMDAFLLTDCLINKRGFDINAWPHGDFTALNEYLMGLVVGN